MAQAKPFAEVFPELADSIKWARGRPSGQHLITDYIARDDVTAAIGVRDEIESQIPLSLCP